MMNTEPLLNAANDIEAALKTEKGRLHFNMNTFKESLGCGTSACVAGFIAARERPNDYFNADYYNAATDAATALGLKWNEWIGDDLVEHGNEKLLHELFHADSLQEYFADESIEANQYIFLTKHAEYVPAMLRWMVENNTYKWDLAVSAVMPEMDVGRWAELYVDDEE